MYFPEMPAPSAAALETACGYSGVIAMECAAIGVASAGGYLHEIVFLPPSHPAQAPRDAVAEKALEQIERYLADPDARFDLPLFPHRSVFRRRVWQAISLVPRGQTRFYGDLARDLNSSARAVGQACGDNPYPLVVPCHRVVGAASTGGFAHASAGFLIATKHWLLRHEDMQANIF